MQSQYEKLIFRGNRLRVEIYVKQDFILKYTRVKLSLLLIFALLEAISHQATRFLRRRLKRFPEKHNYALQSLILINVRKVGSLVCYIFQLQFLALQFFNALKKVSA